MKTKYRIKLTLMSRILAVARKVEGLGKQAIFLGYECLLVFSLLVVFKGPLPSNQLLLSCWGY